MVRIAETRLLTAMTKEEIFAEATSVYDSYVEALETEAFEAPCSVCFAKDQDLRSWFSVSP